MFVITGASGNTGKVAAESLLAAGKKVRVIGRSEDRLQDLKSKGAELAIGDLQDAEFLNTAFSGAEGAYLMIPPKFDADDFKAYQKAVAQNFHQVLSKNKVSHVVTLSSYGAHLEEGLGVVSGLYPLEQLINSIEGINVIHLRAGYFYENFLAAVPLIKQQDVLGGFPIAGNVKLNMVLARDIGEAAGQHLADKDFSGSRVIFLAHDQAHTLQEAATILGKAIGKPELSYVAFPADGAKQAMMGMGMSESLVDNYLIFSEGVSAGKLDGENENHTKQSSPTSLSDFAKIFASVYHAQDDPVYS